MVLAPTQIDVAPFISVPIDTSISGETPTDEMIGLGMKKVVGECVHLCATMTTMTDGDEDMRMAPSALSILQDRWLSCEGSLFLASLIHEYCPLRLFSLLAHPSQPKRPNFEQSSKHSDPCNLPFFLGHQPIVYTGSHEQQEQEPNAGYTQDPAQVGRVHPWVLGRMSYAKQMVVDTSEQQTSANAGQGPGCKNDAMKSSNV